MSFSTKSSPKWALAKSSLSAWKKVEQHGKNWGFRWGKHPSHFFQRSNFDCERTRVARAGAFPCKCRDIPLGHVHPLRWALLLCRAMVLSGKGMPKTHFVAVSCGTCVQNPIMHRLVTMHQLWPKPYAWILYCGYELHLVYVHLIYMYAYDSCIPKYLGNIIKAESNLWQSYPGSRFQITPSQAIQDWHRHDSKWLTQLNPQHVPIVQGCSSPS